MKNSLFIEQFKPDIEVDYETYDKLTKYNITECTHGFIKSHTYCGFPSKKEEIKTHKENYKEHLHGDCTKKYFTKANGEFKVPIYKTNEYGYRSDSWKNGEEGNIFLGCSDTFGLGQHWEFTWPFLLTKSLRTNSKIYNLALPGGTIDSCYRVLKSHINNIKGEYVFMLTPEYTRSEFFDDRGDRHFINGSSLKRLKKQPEYQSIVNWYLDYKTHPIHLWVDYNRNLDAIENLCYKAGKKFIHIYNPLYYETFTPKHYGYDIDFAFDCLHRGVTFQKYISYYFSKKIKSPNLEYLI